MDAVDVPVLRMARPDSKSTNRVWIRRFFEDFVLVLPEGKLMPIVLISESMLQRSTATDGRLLRDRVICGFCVRMNPRKRTFRIATSVLGKQFRMNLVRLCTCTQRHLLPPHHRLFVDLGC